MAKPYPSYNPDITLYTAKITKGDGEKSTGHVLERQLNTQERHKPDVC
jgi:hypothetical protein